MIFQPKNRGYLEPESIFNWFKLCDVALDEQRTKCLNDLRSGKHAGTAMIHPDLQGATADEAESFFNSALRELELSSVLWLVTACEGRLRVDLQKRSNDSDMLATRLSTIKSLQAQAYLIPLVDGGIFDAWKDFIRHQITQPLQDQAVQAMGSVKPFIQLRHWLAHGRYWQSPVSIATSTPYLVKRSITKFLDLLEQCTQVAKIRHLE